MTKRIRIDAGTIVAFQGGEHRLLAGGCLVTEGNSIRYVGKRFSGEVDEVIDASGCLVTPGFINVHSHLSESPLDKTLVEDLGRREFANSKLVDVLPGKAQAMDEAAARACVDFSMLELLRTGTTTVMEIGPIGDYTAEAAKRAWLRAYIADGYRSGRWYTEDGHSVRYAWDEAAGWEGLGRAVGLIERLDGRAGGRIQGFLSPMQVDTCTAELLVKSRELSDALGVPLALHVSQAVFEFDEMLRRHGRTPIEWLEDIGFLGERCILGHAILPAGHSWVQCAGDDLGILARHGVSVAHCAWVFARSGIVMESFPRYQDVGINLCLGADSAPQSMLEAMRWAAILGKVAHRQAARATAKDVFDAATLNAAKALQRPDLGRLEAGAKADLLVWDLTRLGFTPCRDPLRALVYSAQAEDLDAVMIDGAWVMREGWVLTVDEAAVTAQLREAAARVWGRFGPGDWAERTVDEISPPSLAPFES
jgi:5-methylthioadenosine/S-adenosylhomocysteine deaminase